MSLEYNKTVWVQGQAPGISATRLNNIEDGIYNNANQINISVNKINILSLFELLLTPDKYKETVFNLDGSITETIKLTSDDSIYATINTTFDDPNPENITTILECSDLNIHNKVVTVFNLDGSITETSEVIS